MEDYKKKSVVDGDKEIVFSKAIKAGKRIYYLDVKKNRKDEMFLAITESKKIVSGEGDDSQVSFEKHKIFLYKENERIVGLIAGVINNYAIDNYDFKAPMRGRVTELVVSSSVRSKGIGKKLLLKMEEYLKSIGCHDVLLGVFCYNTRAISFYEANGYHSRTTDMIKSLGE